MATARPARRLRLILGGGAVVGAFAFTMLVAREPDHFAGGLVLLGGLGAVLVWSGISSRTATTVATGIALLGGELVIAVGRDPETASGAAFAGPALLVLGEAAFLTAELHPQAHVPLRALADRVRRVVALAAAGFAGGVLCLAAGGLGAGGSGGALEVAGALAAIAAAALTAGPALRHALRRTGGQSP